MLAVSIKKNRRVIARAAGEFDAGFDSSTLAAIYLMPQDDGSGRLGPKIRAVARAVINN